MDVLWAVIILGSLGLIFGFSLGFAAKKFYVKLDTRVESIIPMLPNANCGACGFPGCAGFAQAIIDGKVSQLSQCKPGKPEKNFIPIMEFLDKNPNDDGTKINIKV